MNFFLDALLCAILGIYGHNILAKRGVRGKHITGLVMFASLALFVYLPLMFNNVEDGDKPSKDDLGISNAFDEVIQITIRFYLSYVIAFFGSIGILMS